MKTTLGLILLSAVATTAAAQPRWQRDRGDRTHERRARGVIERPRYSGDRRAIVFERRQPWAVARDPHARVHVRGYRPHYAWGAFHPNGGWFSAWRVNRWSAISTVTCEAANVQTGELYPVVSHDVRGWNDANVNAMLDQALDECAMDAGEQACVPTSPPCTIQRR